MNIQVAGENALIIYFAEQASPYVAQQVKQAQVLIQRELKQLLVDFIPSYASLLVVYNIDKTDHHNVRALIRKCLMQLTDDIATVGKIVELPVFYGEDVGIDLKALAQQAKLSVKDVIDIHQSVEYRVYAIGFAPGFAYLGDVDSRIATPRLSTPRKKVPQGAVAIADKQTAIYPSESPGGWNIIGKSPTKMFDRNATETMPVAVGDIVKFNAITKAEFLALGGVL
ncbi:5-oxoprolinase subunit PxpB [Thalassotalea profundi]|uniref:Allophanate hydrolase n=1 Tax=Thalassotalea profundi TaxID=2036687 RepID=A0ABQ3J0G9_9GAMM|nr:5-oxoprolinase subunit PxpB [Thalassotalea profundi]GHE98713.1 allophanate hydrolase [Thalassotalea profundi]